MTTMWDLARIAFSEDNHIRNVERFTDLAYIGSGKEFVVYLSLSFEDRFYILYFDENRFFYKASSRNAAEIDTMKLEWNY